MVKARFSADELYTAWVMHRRNAADAARSLGMLPHSFRHHVRVGDFEARYLAESSGVAEAQRRLAYIEAAAGLVDLTKHLYAIALGKAKQIDSEGVAHHPTYRDQVMAAQTILRAFPPIMSEVEGQPSSLTLVDARSIAMRYDLPVSLSETPLAIGESVDIPLKETHTDQKGVAASPRAPDCYASEDIIDVTNHTDLQRLITSRIVGP